jgi:transposase
MRWSGFGCPATFVMHRWPTILVGTGTLERYLSLPGLGTVLGARILGEFGDDPHHYADGKGRRNYAGTSPITRASGKSPGRAGSLRPQPASR